jgi:hypothetical protein
MTVQLPQGGLCCSAPPLPHDQHLPQAAACGGAHMESWKVRLITSSCCSRVSLLKCTA